MMRSEPRKDANPSPALTSRDPWIRRSTQGFHKPNRTPASTQIRARYRLNERKRSTREADVS
jgi:hypothetical protein